MQRRLEPATRIGRKIGLNDKKGYAVAIFLVLLIVTALFVAYYIEYKPKPAGYSTIYLLDAQKKANDYPNTLIVNQNSTFNVWIGVENHLGGSGNQSYQVLVKTTQSLMDYPVDTQPIQTYSISLANSATWLAQSTTTLNQVGNYSVVFELWHYNADSSVEAYEFTHDYSILNIQVKS